MSQPTSVNPTGPKKLSGEQGSDVISEPTAGDLLSFSVADWFELRGRLNDEPAECGFLLEKSIKKAFETTPNTKEGNATLYMIGLALTRANAWQPGRCNFSRLGQSLKGQPDAKMTSFIVGLPDLEESDVRVAIWFAYSKRI